MELVDRETAITVLSLLKTKKPMNGSRSEKGVPRKRQIGWTNLLHNNVKCIFGRSAVFCNIATVFSSVNAMNELETTWLHRLGLVRLRVKGKYQCDLNRNFPCSHN